MKKRFFARISIIMLICMLSTTAVFATADSKEFSYNLTANGAETIEVQTGDVITVTLKLHRTDATDPYMMYAMQDEICYDGTFFELVEGSTILGSGMVTTDISKVDRYKEVYMNYLSMSGGAQWDSDVLIGSFQLRVVAESGVTKITNQDYLVSLQDGSGSYSCTANEITVIRSTECIVRFVTNGGNNISDQTVFYGEKIEKPDDPCRAGYKFGGWFTDIDLTEEWDFENDIVQGNMSLYAKWVEAENANIDHGNDKPAIHDWIWLIPLLVIIYLLWRQKNKEMK